MLLVATGCVKKAHEPTRPFYMGVTPWPADFTSPAVEEAYRFIDLHCDLVSHHFDEGIPYEEAYHGLAWPAALQNDVSYRKSRSGGKQIFLSVAPLNLTRHAKADYYRESTTVTDIKERWKQLPVNDERVVSAYLHYLYYLIDRLQPQFVNYGVESNDVHWDQNQFVLYRDFLSKVFQQLKLKYPALPFFVSFMVNEHPAALSLASQLLPYTDFISLSAYPYTSASTTADGNTDPKKFPADYFTRFLDLDPARKWGFAETGYIAQNLVVPSYSLDKQGSTQWQKDYLELVINLCQSRRSKFLVWFCSMDYDAGCTRLRSLGLYDDLFGLWQDTGLKDENNMQRPAFDLWVNWKRRTLE